MLSDLLAWRDAGVVVRADLFYWRTATGEEVDLVIGRAGRLIGLEVKATTRPRLADAAHLRSFQNEYGDAVRGCVLLHGGEATECLGPGIAPPWWRVL